MRLFIHDTPIYLIPRSRLHELSGYDFDALVHTADQIFTHHGHVFVDGFSSAESAQLLIRYFSQGATHPPVAITWVVPDISLVKKELLAHFDCIEAAGGLVKQHNTFLLIQRLGRWDLPKGKIETGEKPRKAAQREIWEECGVRGKSGKKIGRTWHTYTYHGMPILKKTHWYLLSCHGQFSLTPQWEEDISEVVWCDRQLAADRLATSYPSIQYVWEKAQNYLKAQDTVNNP